MGKLTKNHRLREKMHIATKRSKQTTLDTLPEVPKKKISNADDYGPKKKIEITEIKSLTREDELRLEIFFRMFPSRKAFSKLTAELHFNNKKLETIILKVLQGPLATDESTFSFVLDMRRIAAGEHVIKVEMFELWDSIEKLNHAQKEVTIDYVPVRREERYIKIPTVKSVAGTGLEVVSSSEKSLYREIAEEAKKELLSKRDEY